MTDIENNPAAKAFNALRGGIFADEPGLGKTIIKPLLAPPLKRFFPVSFVQGKR